MSDLAAHTERGAADVAVGTSAMPPPVGAAHAGGRGIALLALVLALAAGAFSAYLWVYERVQHEDQRRDFAARLAEMESRVTDAGRDAQRAMAMQQEMAAKLGTLETRLAESLQQQSALEALAKDVSRNRDAWLIAEIEYTVRLANQQLLVAGNVPAALNALENVEQRMQRMEHPRYGALRRVLARDIERLRGLPVVDVYATGGRVDQVLAAVDGLPLAMDARAQPAARPVATSAELPLWRRVLQDFWKELRQLVSIRRVDGQDTALLVPEQTYFLRENLKLRLLGARVALLARDAKSYQADVRAALAALERYFDQQDTAVAAAAATLRKLQSAPVQVTVPELTETLEALRKLHETRAQAPAKAPK